MEIAIYIILSLLIGFGLGYYIATIGSKKVLASNEGLLDKEKEKLEQIRKEMENSFKAIAADVSKSNTEEFLKLANDKFQSLSKESDTNLEQKKKLILVEWSPDGQLILASTAEGECYVYDAFGHICDEFILFPSDRHTVGPLTCMTWHLQNSSCSEISRPSLVRQIYSCSPSAEASSFDLKSQAFGFEKGLVQLMRDEKDRDPLIIDVGISIVHVSSTSTPLRSTFT